MSRFVPTLRLLALLLALSGGPLSAAVELINGAAASVGGKVITVRDAQFYRALQRYREGAGNLFSKESAEELKKTVQKVALEEMVSLEMKSFRYGESARPEADKLLRSRRANDKGGQWKRMLSTYGKTETAAVDSLARTLEIEKFLQKKIETLTPVITDAEVERHYRQNPGRYNVGDLETNRAQIIRDLKFERMQKALEDWVQTLREKYRFVNHLPAGGERSAPGKGKG